MSCAIQRLLQGNEGLTAAKEAGNDHHRAFVTTGEWSDRGDKNPPDVAPEVPEVVTDFVDDLLAATDLAICRNFVALMGHAGLALMVERAMLQSWNPDVCLNDQR